MLDEMKKDADIFFKAVDFVESFTLVGGEPLFYPDIEEFITYVMEKYRHKVLSAWNIITNGTIVPSEEVLDCIKKYSGEIEISDYSATLRSVEKSIEQLTIKLKEKGIPYSIYKADQWIDFGYGHSFKEGWTEERLINFFDQCQIPCRLVKDGGGYYCANSKMAQMAGLTDKDSGNFFDLSHFEKGDTRALMEFDSGYSGQGCLNMCKGCNGYRTINRQYIPVAEQEEHREIEMDK
ncbi:hypothetical protein [Hungatella hathewayi]|uniref:hypothetical protein n=1 Tax=Hungatella hathewayi TaxID=154046 RepID=UPI0035672819